MFCMDGIQSKGFMSTGQAWQADGTFYVYNVTKNGQCSGMINHTTTPIPGGADVVAEAKRQDMDFQPVVHLMDPEAAIRSMNASGANSKYITSFVAAAKQHGWKGLNLDWEGSNTTSTRTDFLAFMTLMNAFADGFAEHGLVFSTDVQWVTQWTHLNPTAMSELTALLASVQHEEDLLFNAYLRHHLLEMYTRQVGALRHSAFLLRCHYTPCFVGVMFYLGFDANRPPAAPRSNTFNIQSRPSSLDTPYVLHGYI